MELRRSRWKADQQRVKGSDDVARRANRKMAEVRAKLERIFELLQVEHGEDLTLVMFRDMLVGKKLFRHSIAQLVAEFFADRKWEQAAGLISETTMIVKQSYARNFATFDFFALVANGYGNDVQKLPIKSNQKRNRSLKEISSFCRVPVLLSTKIARKTFANFALNVLMIETDDVAAWAE